MDQQQLQKKMAAEYAVQFVEDGMKLGLGTGSTVTFLVDALAQKIKDEHLQLTCVTTSSRTKHQAESLGIEIADLNDVDYLDLTIDGADEVDANYQGIKGGGGALTMEKIVATASDQVIWIVDQSKMVQKLGKFPLPVEVLDYGLTQCTNRLDKMDYHPVLRRNDVAEPFRTHFKNLILDLHLEEINDPHQLAAILDQQVGVVEHGLFLDMVNKVIVGTPDGPQLIDNIR